MNKIITQGTLSDDVLEGSDEADQIIAMFGDDVLNGAGGDDSLKAGAGDDTVDGGSGDDEIDGGTGNDVLLGGLGADTFVFKPFGAPGLDVIADFNASEDKLVFDLPGDFSKFDLDASVLTVAHSGNDLIVTIENTDLHLTLQNFSGPLEAPINVTFI